MFTLFSNDLPWFRWYNFTSSYAIYSVGWLQFLPDVSEHFVFIHFTHSFHEHIFCQNICNLESILPYYIKSKRYTDKINVFSEWFFMSDFICVHSNIFGSIMHVYIPVSNITYQNILSTFVTREEMKRSKWDQLLSF